MKNKKGISLIVLVITILVMIILAGVVIVSLQESNPINKAKEAGIRDTISQLRAGISQHVTFIQEVLDVDNEFFKITDKAQELEGHPGYYLLKSGNTNITNLGKKDDTKDGVALKDIIGTNPDLIKGKIYVNKKGDALFALSNKQELIALGFSEEEIANKTIKDNILASNDAK